MALRPLAFGLRFRDGGRTVRVDRGDSGRKGSYVVEVRRPGRKPRRRAHGSLGGALRDFAAAWRSRLH